ncbi:hypothetical protein PUNSTDRAFT_139365 [Punctularia strigosozonata HHB-11173 SS5]|uniref:Uncharacterized protein n=1 Tax=Punctularia strigosozonata (strain HHB-11173) TaxID=741275 RepID=R7S1C9_PUNST|nr:uncharacterized protein PUNSTDRAFT_139365 [Punctularia strigosozonata HHB-11173 SS5]EIN03649.1 hypothetical protein PUNSTDRAFT_139365 [Punctularia strigosozonata HHB-11173 SS5]
MPLPATDDESSESLLEIPLSQFHPPEVLTRKAQVERRLRAVETSLFASLLLAEDYDHDRYSDNEIVIRHLIYYHHERRLFGTTPEHYLEYLFASTKSDFGHETFERVGQRFLHLYEEWSEERIRSDDQDMAALYTPMLAYLTRDWGGQWLKPWSRCTMEPNSDDPWDVTNPFIFWWSERKTEAKQLVLYLEDPDRYLEIGGTFVLVAHIGNFRQFRSRCNMEAEAYLTHVFANGGISDQRFFHEAYREGLE